MKAILYLALTVVLPNASFSETMALDCKLDFSGSMQLKLDRDAGEIGLISPSGIPATIPYINATNSVLFASWVTFDGEQLSTISQHRFR